MSGAVLRNTEEVLRVLSRGEVFDRETLQRVRRMLELDDIHRVRRPIEEKVKKKG